MSARRLPLEEPHAGPLPLIGMFAAVTAWGLGNILIKQMSVDGLTVAFYRLWMGSLLTVAILAVARHRPTPREFALSAPAGALFGVNMVLGFTAIRLTTVADATLIGALQPALVLIVAGAWFGEKIGRREIGWTAVSIAGIGILIAGASNSPEWSPLGDGLALLGVILFTGYFLASKRIRTNVATVAYMAGVQISAAIVVTPVVLVHGLQVSSMTNADWLRITTVVFTSGVGAHMLVNWAHPYVRVSLSSVIVLLTPVVSSIAAWVVLDESLSGIQLIGGAITLVAIVAFTRTHRGGEEDALIPMSELPEPTIAGG